MRHEITLTDAEREKLERVHDAHFAGHIDRATDAAWTVEFITAALAAVPRLALASPVVGEVVNIADSLGKIALREHSGHSGDEETGEHYGDCERCEVEGLLAKLAALTGEEGRDGE